jgi:hypothetical protein
MYDLLVLSKSDVISDGSIFSYRRGLGLTLRGLCTVRYDLLRLSEVAIGARSISGSKSPVTSHLKLVSRYSLARRSYAQSPQPHSFNETRVLQLTKCAGSRGFVAWHQAEAVPRADA